MTALVRPKLGPNLFEMVERQRIEIFDFQVKLGQARKRLVRKFQLLGWSENHRKLPDLKKASTGSGLKALK